MVCLSWRPLFVLDPTLAVLPMKRVAIFGNAGGGKSALAKRLAEMTRLPLHTIEKILVQPRCKQKKKKKEHADLLRRDKWIIDGFGSVASAWERFAQADTLLYIDLPLITLHRSAPHHAHSWATQAPHRRPVSRGFIIAQCRATLYQILRPKYVTRSIHARALSPILAATASTWKPVPGASRNLCMIRGRHCTSACSHSFNHTPPTHQELSKVSRRLTASRTKQDRADDQPVAPGHGQVRLDRTIASWSAEEPVPFSACSLRRFQTPYSGGTADGSWPVSNTDR